MLAERRVIVEEKRAKLMCLCACCITAACGKACVRAHVQSKHHVVRSICLVRRKICHRLERERES